jgi:hypothetical protein
MRLGGPQGQSGPYGKEKKILVPAGNAHNTEWKVKIKGKVVPVLN